MLLAPPDRGVLLRLFERAKDDWFVKVADVDGHQVAVLIGDIERSKVIEAVGRDERRIADVDRLGKELFPDRGAGLHHGLDRVADIEVQKARTSGNRTHTACVQKGNQRAPLDAAVSQVVITQDETPGPARF